MYLLNFLSTLNHAGSGIRLLGSMNALFFGVFLFGAPALWGQSMPAPGSADGEPFLGRFAVGGRLSVLISKPVNRESSFHSTSTPPVSTTLSTQPTAGRFGFAPTAQVALLERVALSFDVFYRKAGFESQVEVLEGADAPAITTTFQETTAEFWDVPILARVYNIGRHRAGNRVFFSGGMGIRHVSNIRTFTVVTRPDGLSDTDETPITPANNMIKGIVVGAGFQSSDDIGLKVMPEVRFTRWLDRTFAVTSPSPAFSSKYQIEVLLGITW